MLLSESVKTKLGFRELFQVFLTETIQQYQRTLGKYFYVATLTFFANNSFNQKISPSSTHE